MVAIWNLNQNYPSTGERCSIAPLFAFQKGETMSIFTIFLIAIATMALIWAIWFIIRMIQYIQSGEYEIDQRLREVFKESRDTQ
jgi:hypothetical protein